MKKSHFKRVHLVAWIIALTCFFSISGSSQSGITPATAIQHYLHNGDTVYHWEIKERYDTPGGQAYALLLTSQQWRRYTWTHQLFVFVPKENNYDGALLHITGGSVKNGLPDWKERDDQLLAVMSETATKNKAIVAVLRQTPNEPLFDSLEEDALISYTLHQFKIDGDYTWPLLFPMVKSAVRAMDALQEFAKNDLHHPIRRFVVSGASKRGWTTWLTGANDDRVEAIAPMVIDVLNMPVNLNYQIKAWHKYSIQIEDYVKLGIPQVASSPSGKAINTMVDPYSYREKLTMPKMIFMGTNDEYWVVDAVKNYYDSIPGRNMLNYIPNAGHDLAGGKVAFQRLSAFFGYTLNHQPYPDCSWKISSKNRTAKLEVTASPGILVTASLWSAQSPDMIFTKSNWTAKNLRAGNNGKITASEKFPASGFQAFYVELEYMDPNGGPYTESTRMFVVDSKGVN